MILTSALKYSLGEVGIVIILGLIIHMGAINV